MHKHIERLEKRLAVEGTAKPKAGAKTPASKATMRSRAQEAGGHSVPRSRPRGQGGGSGRGSGAGGLLPRAGPGTRGRGGAAGHDLELCGRRPRLLAVQGDGQRDRVSTRTRLPRARSRRGGAAGTSPGDPRSGPHEADLRGVADQRDVEEPVRRGPPRG